MSQCNLYSDRLACRSRLKSFFALHRAGTFPGMPRPPSHSWGPFLLSSESELLDAVAHRTLVAFRETFASTRLVPGPVLLCSFPTPKALHTGRPQSTKGRLLRGESAVRDARRSSFGTSWLPAPRCLVRSPAPRSPSAVTCSQDAKARSAQKRNVAPSLLDSISRSTCS